MDEQEYDDHELSWELDARTAISEAISDCEKDEVRGHMYLRTGRDQRENPIQEEFPDWNSLYYRLTEIGESAWIDAVPWDRGPVFEPDVEGYVDNAMSEIEADKFFFRSAGEDIGNELFDASEFLAPDVSGQVRIDVEEITRELIQYMARHPSKMSELTPRKFEELVAELFRDMGYDVELTPASKDGGFDIRAVRKTEIGEGLYLIECKRFAREKKVGVEIVRSLHGVVESEKATAGLVVTTSFFTRGAFEFRDRNRYRLDLADQVKLQEYLASYGKK